MTINWSVKATDVAIIFATLLGPILAVQAQKWLERRGSEKQRQLAVFRALMATRASSLSSAHVDALNAVPIEFYGVSPVVDAWKDYLDHMGKDPALAMWAETRVKLLVDMLHAMSAHLGYRFNKVEIKNEVYWPRKHGEVETDQDLIRRGMALLLSGQIALPMDVKSLPIDVDAASEQRLLREALLRLLEGHAALKVTHAEGQR